MKNKIFITAALTGAVTPKSLNEHLPITPEEIATDAYACWKAGASVVHIHMRDEDGKGSMDVDLFKKTVKLIRAHEDCDVVICATSSGTQHPIPEEARMAPFREIPEIEMGSYDVGTFNWACQGVFDNNPKFLVDLAKCYEENNVLPEIELFDTGMITNMNYYIKKGMLKSPVYCQFALGVLGAAPATVDSLLHLVKQVPEDSVWSAFGIGKDHLPIMYTSLALGAHGIRVGLEDNVMYAKDVLATNVTLVERAVRVIEEFGKEIATSAEAREILKLNPLVR